MKTATRQQPAERSDEQALQDATAEAQARLSEIDDQIKSLEVVRDAAEAQMAAIRTTTGDPVSLWRAEEQYEAAQRQIAALLEERRPVADRHRRLAAVAEPLAARDREIERLRHAVAGMEILREVFPLLDRICDLVGQARPHLAESRGTGSVPPSLSKFVTTWGPLGATRHRVEASTGVGGLDALRARLERLEQGALL